MGRIDYAYEYDLGVVQTTPAEFENGFFTLKTY